MLFQLELRLANIEPLEMHHAVPRAMSPLVYIMLRGSCSVWPHRAYLSSMLAVLLGDHVQPCWGPRTVLQQICVCAAGTPAAVSASSCPPSKKQARVTGTSRLKTPLCCL